MPEIRRTNTRAHGAPGLLVLEDNAVLRQLTARFLTHVGYRVDTAADGETGWRALCTTQYELLVTDHEMPRLTGLRLIERLRSAGLTIPVIIASGSLNLGRVEDYPRLGLTAILHKPFAFAELILAVRRVVPIANGAGPSVVPDLESPRHPRLDLALPSRPDWFAEPRRHLPDLTSPKHNL